MKVIIFALVCVAALVCAVAADYRSTVILGRVQPLIREYEGHYTRYRSTNARLAQRLNNELTQLRTLERDLNRASRNLDFKAYNAYERRYQRHQQRLRELLST
ncbi:unnamed protein product [Medioppia subpectinata]|uniref:Uncharacterized protein n=1 Tax=Medioppia subpectinata TaxID=1979941 RepID=A0A7R9KJJ6_9ACAR|nr:unnamed protein product [Medioppia subpectinata]CAG2103554.1 unnamed protein product [Medioppia subpectinata]